MNEICGCGQPALVRYRILPHRHLAASKVWAPAPRDVLVCEKPACHAEVVKGGTVLKVESLVEGAVVREVKGEP